MINLPNRFRSATGFLPKSKSQTTSLPQADQDTKTHRRSQLINWALGLVCIGWAGALVGCGSSETATTLGDWRTRSSLEGPARSAATGFVIGNFGYVGTGFDASNNRLKDFWAYDQTKNSWAQIADFGGVGRVYAVGFSIGAKGYVGTGIDANSVRLKDFWEYDQASNAWKKAADFGGTARQQAVAFAVGNKGYIGTGFDGNYLKDFWSFDPSKNTWTKVTSYSGEKRQGAVAIVLNGLAYVGTGNNNNTAQRDWYAYDPAQDAWVEKTQFSTDQSTLPRSSAVGFAINNLGYITTGDASSTTVWQYNPASDSWTTLGNFEGATRVNAVGFAIGGKGYVTTGGVGTGRYDDLWEFDPTIAQVTE
ncbi:Kelch repeat-containing protein [Spirosoma oryzicola]|uniref:Kelch repeat-containing protein n=1 Tax=Spirosoma oryzicola TaxID=2898794 RepID=UPI001E6148F3|nr:kelch repeat-containing protein [Spirosoma oryzicola]UHG92690.1 galactose oxidase [Spirosoma oryzicola]